MKIELKIDQALKILHELGIPVNELPATRKKNTARAFLALTGVTPRNSWADAKDANSRHLSSKQILAFGREYFGEKRSDGSYDDVRRKDLKRMTLAEIVIPAANKPGATTNDGTRGYGIHPEAAKVVRTYGTDAWAGSLRRFRKKWPALADQMARKRQLGMIPIVLPDGITLHLREETANGFMVSVCGLARNLMGSPRNRPARYMDACAISSVPSRSGPVRRVPIPADNPVPHIPRGN